MHLYQDDCYFYRKIIKMKEQEDFKNIQEIRDAIDKIDYQIIKLFGDRNQCVKEIINFKTDKEGVIAIKRQEELLGLRRKWAEELNLEPDLFEKIFRILINSNIKKQMGMLEQ